MHLLKPIERTRVNANALCGLWVIMTSQRRFSICNKSPSGEGCGQQRGPCMRGAEGIGDISVLSTPVCSGPKTALNDVD